MDAVLQQRRVVFRQDRRWAGKRDTCTQSAQAVIVDVVVEDCGRQLVKAVQVC
jgi:hypothetical protein